MRKRKDPKVGTGKKPKGSGRRLYSCCCFLNTNNV